MRFDADHNQLRRFIIEEEKKKTQHIFFIIQSYRQCSDSMNNVDDVL